MASVEPVQYMQPPAPTRQWSQAEVEQLFAMPFMDLMFQAQQVHREYFEPNRVQLSTLISIKTGACPEDCAYCPQSAHYDTELEKEKLLPIPEILDAAQKAVDAGATRFCMGAAWRNPSDRELPQVLATVRAVKELGLETCATLGMLKPEQAHQLAEAGLDYYNHNLDTSENYYDQIITTRTYQDRLDTLQSVRDAGMNVCAGGIVGMGEQESDRIGLLRTLANLPKPPESVPINMLVKIPGTPLDQVEDLDEFDFVRTIAVARILMPESYVRLSAGRHEMNDQMQALCFMAGANSIFYGEELLTTENSSCHHDRELFDRLGIRPEGA